MKSSVGVIASWVNVVSSFAAFGLGMIILGKGGSAGTDAIATGAPLLLAAEAVKLVIGGSLTVQVHALGRATGGWVPKLTGFAGALLMIVAGGAGIAAILNPDLRSLASFVNPLASGAVVATGLWALTSVLARRKDGSFPVWMACVGWLLPIPSMAMVFVPAAGLGAFVLGVLWNIGVATVLGGRRTQ